MPRAWPLLAAMIAFSAWSASAPKATGERVVVAALLEVLPPEERASLGPGARLEAIAQSVGAERREAALAALARVEAQAGPAALKAVLRARFLLGDAQGGLTASETLLRTQPGPEAEALNGWALSWSGDYEAAYGRGVELARKDPANRDAQALIAFNKGRAGKAAAVRTTPAILRPSDGGAPVGGAPSPKEASEEALAIMRRAVEARRAGDMDAVLALAREAMRTDPKAQAVQELYRLVVADRARQEGLLRERLLAQERVTAPSPEAPEPPSQPELPPLWPLAAGAGLSAALYGINNGRKSWGDEGRSDPEPEVSPERSRLNYLRSAVVIGAPLLIGALLTGGPYLAGAAGAGAGSLQRVAASRAGFVATSATGKVARWGPATGQGPLEAAVVASFRGGAYSEIILEKPLVLYRVYGGAAEKIGRYWTRTPPTGPLQARIDNALLPSWGNTAQSVATIEVPAGTTVFEGYAAAQGGMIGGGVQIYLPQVRQEWVLK